MIRNVAGQVAEGQVVNATTGAPFVGVVTVYITIDQQPQVIGSVGVGLATHAGNGLYRYLPSQSETDGAVCTFQFVGTGAVPAATQYQTYTVQQLAGLGVASGLGAVPMSVVIVDALNEINASAAGDTPGAEDVAFGLGKLNRLLDNWNADGASIYADQYSTFTLTPSLSPHTIGPSGTFYAIQRPEDIIAARLVLVFSQSIFEPIVIRDRAWWLAQPVPGLTSSIVTDLYYEPSWPNGSLYFQPVPSAAMSVELTTRVVLGAVTLTDTFSLPPGYRDAVTLTLAESMAPAFGQTASATLVMAASKARARAFGRNVKVPRMSTSDAGMPGGSGGGDYNYLTGRNR